MLPRSCGTRAVLQPAAWHRHSDLPEGIFTRATTGSPHGHEEKGAARAILRIVNDRQEIDYSGARQTMGEDGGLVELSGMNHNVLGGFLDVQPAIESAGRHGARLIPRSEEHTSELQSLRHPLCR